MPKKPMTPKEFAAKMQEIYYPLSDYDVEATHVEADKLLCEMLKQLGYEQGIEIYSGTRKWYA